MYRKPIFAVLLLIIIILCGCSEMITDGEVIEKEFTPAHTELRSIPVSISNGKTSSVILIPFAYHYADKWTVTIRKWNDEKQVFDTATYRVEKTVFDSINIGDEFVYTEEMTPNEPEYIRERTDDT